jgi:hypothetical protein
VKEISPPDHEFITPEIMRTQLRAASTLDGVSSYECAIDLETLPGQDEVQRELNDVPKVTKSKAKKNIKPDDAELMRIARARCRPLLKLIHEATGYSFVFVSRPSMSHLDHSC